MSEVNVFLDMHMHIHLPLLQKQVTHCYPRRKLCVLQWLHQLTDMCRMYFLMIRCSLTGIVDDVFFSYTVSLFRTNLFSGLC